MANAGQDFFLFAFIFTSIRRLQARFCSDSARSRRPEIRVEIIDLLGRKVLNETTLQENQGYQYVSLDISKLSLGYYVIQVFQGDRRLGRGNFLISDR